MKLFILFLIAFFLVGCVQVVPEPDPSRPKPESGKVVFVAELIDAHNKLREEHGKGPLALNPALQQAAEAHARDMAKNKFMSHKGSDRSSPFKRIERAGYAYSLAGENVAWNQSSVAEVMKSWMWSPGHRMNILMGSYTEIGAACVYSDSGQPYWCVDFGKPSSGVQAMSQSDDDAVVESQDNASSMRMKSAN